jgi:hypothetical protein
MVRNGNRRGAKTFKLFAVDSGLVRELLDRLEHLHEAGGLQPARGLAHPLKPRSALPQKSRYPAIGRMRTSPHSWRRRSRPLVHPATLGSSPAARAFQLHALLHVLDESSDSAARPRLPACGFRLARAPRRSRAISRRSLLTLGARAWGARETAAALHPHLRDALPAPLARLELADRIAPRPADAPPTGRGARLRAVGAGGESGGVGGRESFAKQARRDAFAQFAAVSVPVDRLAQAGHSAQAPGDIVHRLTQERTLGER